MGSGASHEIVFKLTVRKKNTLKSLASSNTCESQNFDEKFRNPTIFEDINAKIAGIEAAQTKDVLRRPSSKKLLKLSVETDQRIKPFEVDAKPENKPQIVNNTERKKSVLENSDSDGNRQHSAAILIQRHVRGIEARAFTATRKITKQAEQFVLRSLNTHLSPAENACNLLKDIISASACIDFIRSLNPNHFWTVHSGRFFPRKTYRP